MTWRDGYLLQAESDFSYFQRFNKAREPRCQQLHYLQMATEKLAKAILCSGNNKPYEKTHYAFVRLLKLSTRHPKIYKLLGYPGNRAAYRTYIDSLLPAAKRIEDLAPVGGDHDKLNAEYPWRDHGGTVLTPTRYEYPELSKTDMAKLQTIMADLIRISRAI